MEIASFTLAQNTSKDKPATFISCKVFGLPASWIKSSKKGERITVQGTLSTYEYTNKEGKKQSGMEVLVDSFSREYKAENYVQPQQQSSPAFPVSTNMGSLGSQSQMFNEDDCPF